MKKLILLAALLSCGANASDLNEKIKDSLSFKDCKSQVKDGKITLENCDIRDKLADAQKVLDKNKEQKKREREEERQAKRREFEKNLEKKLNEKLKDL